MLRWFVVASVLAAAVPVSGTAQTVRGTVSDSVLGNPVGRGFVVLVGSDGREIRRALTNADGSFTLQAPRAGSYQIRSERIGYRRWTSDPFALTANEDLTLDLRVAALPVRLAEMSVEGETSCRVDDEKAQSIALLWDEAQKALAGAAWSAQEQIYRQTLYRYERDFDRRHRTMLEERSSTRTGYYQAPFKSLAPESLAVRGYVQDARGSSWYYAPDATVLRHPSFHASHCFEVVRDRGEYPGWVGLAFEPVTRRRLPEIEGVLWLDEGSSELRLLEYEYVNLPGGLRDDALGGTLRFMPMPTGAWIVNEWVIRTPRLEEGRREFGASAQTQLTIQGFQDVGGEVVEVRTLENERVYRAPMAVIVGTVFDSTRGVPMRGATVNLAGTRHTVVTDESGAFSIEAPLNGEFQLSFRHPRLDSITYRPPNRDVRLTRGEELAITLATPPLRKILDSFCSGFKPGTNRRMIVGVVTDEMSGVGVPDATVNAHWQEVTVSVDRREIRAVRGKEDRSNTNDHGAYVLCDLPHTFPITLVAARAVANTPIRSDSMRIYFELDGRVVLLNDWSVPSAYWAPDGVWRVDLIFRREE